MHEKKNKSIKRENHPFLKKKRGRKKANSYSWETFEKCVEYRSPLPFETMAVDVQSVQVIMIELAKGRFHGEKQIENVE